MRDWVGDIDPRTGMPLAVEAASREIIGAAIEVHRNLGPGFLESVYQRALIHELNLRGLGVRVEVPIVVQYKGLRIEGQRLDVLIDPPGVVIELKAVEKLLPIHGRQLLSYLKTTGYRLGLLINFNVQLLKQGGLKRIAN